MTYKKRKIFDYIVKFIPYKEALVVYGARQVGKTTVMKMLIDHLIKNGIAEKDIFYLDLEDLDMLQICNQGVPSLLAYIQARSPGKEKKYVFIDEIQYMNTPSNLIKLLVDNHSDDIKLIVSGSSALNLKSKLKRSLVGRTVTFEMHGLDFGEFLWFNDIHIDTATASDKKATQDLNRLFHSFSIFGSYPRAALIQNIEEKKYYLRQVIQTYIKRDVKDIGNIRNIMKFNDFLRILANQAGSLLNITSLASDTGLARETVYDYLALLEGTYICTRLTPFHRNIKNELTKMPKVYFEDNGVLNYLLHNDFIDQLTGPLFENSVYCELKKNTDSGKLHFWRTQTKQEIDFIIENPKSLTAVETKRTFSGRHVQNLDFFSEKYPGTEKRIVTLEKRKPASKDVTVYYPWQIV